jgi:hypothetical protein
MTTRRFIPLFNYNSRMRILWISIVPIFLALYSCNSTSKKQLIKTESYCVYLEDVKINRKAIKVFDIISLRNQLTAFYFNTTDSSINFVKLDSNGLNNKHTKFYLKKTLKKSIIEPQLKWLIVNYDTIFALSSQNEQIYMFNVSDQIIDSFPLYPQNNTEDYICFSSDFGSMKYSNNKLLVPVSSGVNFNNETNEYSSISGLIIDISNKTLNKFTRSSKEVILDVGSYTNPYDYFEIHQNKVFYSSEENASMFVYDLNSDKTSCFKANSKFIKNITPCPDSLFFDREARINYTIHEPRYSRIGYYPDNNYLLRMVKHRTKIPKSDGYYKPEHPKSQYSIILIDSNNKIIDELLMGNEYPSDFIRTTNKGVVLLNKKSDLKKQGLLCLDLFIIK